MHTPTAATHAKIVRALAGVPCFCIWLRSPPPASPWRWEIFLFSNDAHNYRDYRYSQRLAWISRSRVSCARSRPLAAKAISFLGFRYRGSNAMSSVRGRKEQAPVLMFVAAKAQIGPKQEQGRQSIDHAAIRDHEFVILAFVANHHRAFPPPRASCAPRSPVIFRFDCEELFSTAPLKTLFAR